MEISDEKEYDETAYLVLSETCGEAPGIQYLDMAS